jgi:KDO2-lipid IV(A) lauroyltransferase
MAAEMYDVAARDLPWMKVATMYRPGQSRVMARILEHIRRDCRCRFFRDGTDDQELRAFLQGGDVILGIMSDVDSGSEGVSLPFFGRAASTPVAPVLHALRHRMPLHAAVCFRTAPGRWRVEISDEILTRVNGRVRGVEDILQDLNAHFENCIKRDPANWYWTQARWEHAGRRRREPSASRS